MLLCNNIELFESVSESRVSAPAATVVVVVDVVVDFATVEEVGALVVEVDRAVTRTRALPVTVVPPEIGSKRGIQSPPGASGLIQKSP